MLEAQGYDGAIASPHVLTTQAGMDALARGGSAVDAAIAANAVQGVVAPETCGIGGDLFALIHSGDTVSALNSSGWAGSNVSASSLRDAGLSSIPQHHAASVTIPGCVAGWFEMHGRHGKLPMRDNLQRAIDLAREGFPASTEYSRATQRMAAFLAEHADGAELLQDGRPPRRGDRVRRPNLASSLERIGAEGPSAFYEGPVAAAISAAVEGLITPDDLAAYRPDWVDPISTEVFGVRGWTIPPNSQGYLTLATLKLFEALTPTRDPGDPRWTHFLVEAYRAVAAERDDIVADPRHAPLPSDQLLDGERLSELGKDVTDDRVARRPRPSTRPGGTMFLCVVDGSGLAVSLIESNFRGIGSGFGAGDSGFVLHDRGGGFDLRAGHPNEIAGGKRPLHTLSPSLWTSEGRLRTTLGTRGGHQQPQILAQVAALLFAAERTPGEAQRAPRWTISDITTIGTGSSLEIESGTSAQIAEGLHRRGHGIEVKASRVPGWGPVSIIDVSADGLRTAAADPRVDTAVAAAR